MSDKVPFTGLIAGNLNSIYAANSVVVTGINGAVLVNSNIYIDGSGNVGIGTTNPTTNFNVPGSATINNLYVGNIFAAGGGLFGNASVVSVSNLNSNVITGNTVTGGTFIGNISTNTITSTNGVRLTASSGNISTSTTTGALVVTGGVGISGNLYVGGNLIVEGNVRVKNTEVSIGNTLILDGNNVSVNTSTGDLVILGTGGAGIGGNINVGGPLSTFSGNVGIGTSTVAALTRLAVYGGDLQVGTTGRGIVYPDGTIQTSAPSYTNLVFTYTGDGATASFSTSPLTATSVNNTIVFVGGVYQRKNTYSWAGTTLTFTTIPPQFSLIEINITAASVGFTTSYGALVQTAQVTNADASTSTVTGALRVTGGAGFGGNINVGGSVSLFTNTVGIGTSSNVGMISGNALTVFGNVNITGGYFLNGSPFLGGGTLTNNSTTNANTYYLTMSNAQTSGTFLNVVVSSSQLYFNPALGQLAAASFLPVVGSNIPAAGMYTPSANVLTFSSSGSERVRINTVGNVGIGTTTPVATLEVQNTAGNSGTVLARFSGASGRFVSIIDNDGSGAAGVLATNIFGASGASGTLRLRNTYGNANNSNIIIDNNYVSIATSSATVATERLRIDTNGNVGIGTATPTQRLFVIGNADVTGHFALGNTSSIDTLSTDSIYTGSTISSTLLLQENVSGNLAIKSWNSDIISYINYSHTGTSPASIYSLDIEPNVTASSTGPITYFYGSYVRPVNQGLGAVSELVGTYTSGRHLSSNTVTTGVGLSTTPIDILSSGNVTNNYGILVSTATDTGTGINNNLYGIYINDQSSKSTADNFNLYSAGANSKNYFAGNVIVGNSITVTSNVTANSFVYSTGTPANYTYYLDDISSRFNGVDKTFTLTSDGAAVSITNPVTLQLIVGGIPITPARYISDLVDMPEIVVFNKGFTVSGSTVTFATAPLNGMDFYGVVRTQDPSITFKYKQTPFSALNIMFGP